MEHIPDAPDIARTLRTGYPGEPHFPPECPRCGDPMDTAYLIDNQWQCGECFEEWLDEQFTALECEPLRASGKVLLADKVLVVAQAAGSRLLNDETWLHTYARATHAVLTKPMITVDVSAMAVTY